MIYFWNWCQYGDEKCLINGKSDCSKMFSTYTIKCLTCKQSLSPDIKEYPSKPGGILSSHYIGMTACSIHSRLKSHREGHERCDGGNPLHKHDLEAHQGIAQKYQAEFIQSDRGLLHLALREALLIEGQDMTISLNDKMEQGRGKIVRLSANRIWSQTQGAIWRWISSNWGHIDFPFQSVIIDMTYIFPPSHSHI